MGACAAAVVLRVRVMLQVGETLLRAAQRHDIGIPSTSRAAPFALSRGSPHGVVLRLRTHTGQCTGTGQKEEENYDYGAGNVALPLRRSVSYGC